MQQANVDMNSIVEDIMIELKKDNINRNIEWQVSRLPLVFADESLLYQVWSNLLRNSIKFTRNKEKAVIKIDVTDKRDEYVFSVSDNGVGFDMKYAKNLFGVFQRLHSYADFEGTGIGLANVRNIILKHKGLTWAEAEPNKGAIFYFTLPKQTEN
jgi:light-regulated signal transduction histidine kinase (bacteriophytochrome)